MKPKKQRRNQVKNASLIKRYNPRIRQEKIDMDYLDQLSSDELAWLGKFMEEENNASFKDDGTDFNQSKEERKKIYDRNNASNRCLLGNLKNKANKFNNKKLLNYDNVVNDVEDEISRGIDPMRLENAYVDFIEAKEIESFLIEYDNAMLSFNEVDE